MNENDTSNTSNKVISIPLLCVEDKTLAQRFWTYSVFQTLNINKYITHLKKHLEKQAHNGYKLSSYQIKGDRYKSGRWKRE